MKKLLVAALAIFSLSSFVSAQEFKPFRVDIMGGYAFMTGSGAKGGASLSIEPRYAAMDRLQIGLRLESAFTARGWVAGDGSAESGSAEFSLSYMATSDYYFSNNYFRPFFGAGFGLSYLASSTLDVNGQTRSTPIEGESKFGGMIRAGFEFNHFRFALEYNIISQSQLTVTDGSGNPLGVVTGDNNYGAVKIGFFIGGGRNGKPVKGNS